jgi:hypothetical protein
MNNCEHNWESIPGPGMYKCARCGMLRRIIK